MPRSLKQRKYSLSGTYERKTNLKGFPEEILYPYQVSTEERVGNWRRMREENYKRLRHEPKAWMVEAHTEVYVGTGGEY